jgi:GNAT superfamily N-acetyltransferase
MTTNIIIRPIRQGEYESVCKVVERSFDRFVGNEYSSEGRTEFYRYANPAAMALRLQSDHFLLVAEYQSRIIGMIEFRKNEHLSMLFVDPSYFKIGVSRLLFEHALNYIRKNNPSLDRITVNSSRYAVPVYESFGFTPEVRYTGR